MKRELEISIRDNWYSDLYPTWIDYVGFPYALRPLAHVFRVFEIFFYRRAQLNYWSKPNK